MAEKKKFGIAKIIAGLVIGGAVGSVLGVTLAPQSGKKTREELKKRAGVAADDLKKLLQEKLNERD